MNPLDERQQSDSSISFFPFAFLSAIGQLVNIVHAGKAIVIPHQCWQEIGATFARDEKKHLLFERIDF